MRIPGGRFIVGTTLLAMASTTAMAGECSNPAHQSAFYVRSLQTELMVAALTCRQQPAYNSFVNRFRPELVGHGKTLKATFARQYGTNAEQYLNGFITRIANETALRSANTQGYCGQSAGMFDDVLDLDPGQLSEFASEQDFSERHGLPTCTAERATGRRIAQSDVRQDQTDGLTR